MPFVFHARKLHLLLSAFFLVALLAACAPAAPAHPSTDITIAMGFIPNVQFAPFYVALEKGYFKDEGLNVTFNYGMETDLIKLLAADEIQFVVGSGDQVILARAQGLPITYVLQWYQKYPVSIVSLAEKGIKTPQDLAGKTVGTPVLAGASYVGWKALVAGAKIPEAAVNLQVVGYTQIESLVSKRVDAAIVYTANEAVQLRSKGYDINEIMVSDYADLVSNGLLTNEKSVNERSDTVGRLVRAMLRGIDDAVTNPQEAFEICLKHVPEAGGDNRALQEAVLKRSIELWRADQPGISRRDSWVKSQDFMRQAGLIDQTTDVDKMFTNRFVPNAK